MKNQNLRFDDFVLRVEITNHEGSGEWIQAEVTSEVDHRPLPLGKGIARSEDRAIAFALQDMADKILKGTRGQE
jgi:hypothetical protein